MPVTLLQLVVGNRFGEAVTSAQSMKIAASEAQWNTCQPCGFSLIQFGGFSEDDETPAFSITVPRLLSYMATGSFGGQVQGLNQLQSEEESKYGSGNYMPNVRVVYWSMRVMAFTGVLMFMVAALGAWLYWKKKLERARWFHRIAILSIAFPYIAASAGWVLTEMGRQPWIVQGLLKTSEANSPSVSTAWIAISLGFFIALYLAPGSGRLRADEALCAARPASDPRGAARAGGDLLMDLQILWFVLIAVLWSGYFLLEGFDFGVGMLLPFTPRTESERGAMFESIGPVWDGNEVWLVVAAGATFAAFPAWYATMFSGFYLAFLLILFFLIIRVVSFEWREKGDGERWRKAWLWANAIGSAGIALIWGIGLANLIHGLPIDSNGDYDGGLVDLFTPYTVFAGLTFVVVFAFHGATYLTLRTTGDLYERVRARGSATRRPGSGRRRGVPRLDGRRRGRSERQGRLPGRDPCRPRNRRARAGRGACLRRQERPRVRDDGAGHRRIRCDAVHGPLSAGHGLEHGLREQPRRSGRRVRALHAGRDDRRGADRAAGRPALPGLVVLRLPRAGHAARTSSCPKPSRRPRAGRPRADVRILDQRLVRRARPVRRLLVLDTAVGIASAALVLLQAVLIARIVAQAFAGASLAAVSSDLALLAVTFCAQEPDGVGLRGGGPARCLDRPLGAAPRTRRAQAPRRSRSLSTGAGAGEIAATAVQGVDGLEAYFARYLPQVVLALIVPLAVLALAAVIDPLSAGLMLLTLPLVPLFMWLIGRYTEERTRERWLSLRLLSNHFLDVVRGLPTLRAFNRAAQQARVLADVGEHYRRTTVGTLRVGFLSGSVLELAATLGVALVAVTVGVRLVDGALGLQAGLTVLVLAPELYLPVRQLAGQFHASADGVAVAQRMLELIERSPDEKAPRMLLAPEPSGRAGAAGGGLLRIPVASGARARLARPGAPSGRDGRAGRTERVREDDRRQPHPRASPSLTPAA